MTEILFMSLAFDLSIGDNLGAFHPVVIIGKYISLLEKRLFRLKHAKLAGILLVVAVCLTSFFLVLFLLKFLSFNKTIYFLASAFVISTTFALKGLLESGFKIYAALKDNNLLKAKALLSQIVGRDTNYLSQEQVIKATIESLAENTIDGIIAPLFYALIGGAPLAILYRAINTLDSMVGYKNTRYKHFGWAAAKLDDIANFIPARISLVFIWVSSFLCGLKFKESVKTAISDGVKHQSPNAGLSEAAFAGALCIQLGGLAYYEGNPVKLACFGAETNIVDLSHIKASLWLVTITSVSFFILAMLLKVML
ncbi:hypothetical protein LCGC14_1892820 [marine sediment metagenome]|uniref:Cobalamin biosynthesis protein CobD n=1 Tax=marine sediment metagenome TaxID=412755 RepID=A0A0F9ICS3_9ZZZZ